MTSAYPPVSEAEREVLKTLWAIGEATVRQIHDSLKASGRRWARTTVNTLLTRLEDKGLVRRQGGSFAHLFQAAVSADDLVQQGLTTLAKDYCDGASVPLMLALVQDHRFTESEITMFRDLLDRIERQAEGRQPVPKRKSRSKRSR